ncbi:MAG: sulfatase [Betaproteobacteria bacterium]|nr:MAG: sulfatase [Betaproteobacteria bacterium]
MGRKILFVTTDQQRYDALGCNGGTIAATPVVDALAAEGIVYRRAYTQNTECMPARSTMLTGLHPRTHGVTMNGIPLPLEGPNIVRMLRERAGYRTALIGKGHFEPSSTPDQSFFENYAARRNTTGPHRGFERMELAAHTGRPGRSMYHYPKWLADHHPEHVEGFFEYIDQQQRPSGRGGGDTLAPQVWLNPIPRNLYHTDWVADRAIAWLDSLDAADDWFLWLSFPDPHHPWDAPATERARHDWRTMPLTPACPGGPERAVEILARKPRHWLECYLGRARFGFSMPPTFVPAALTTDQLREINAVIHVENELIDEALGRVLARIAARGWSADTDVVFTTDHGEMQGDFGLLFKGAFHVDALMRASLVWRPAPSAGVVPACIDDPVGHIDLAPTFAAIAGIEADERFQGAALPVAAGSCHERVLTTWDDPPGDHAIRMATITRARYVCTRYDKPGYYHGDEGELYDLQNDPLQLENRWDDAAYAGVKSDLLADLRDHLPADRTPPLVKVARA